MDLSQSKRVLITGAASGLGKALAQTFVSNNHKVCIVDVNDERGEATLAELQQSNPNCFYRHCDVTSKQQITDCVDAVVERWNGIDIIVNNAGVASGGPFDWLSEDDWNWVMGINFFGVLSGCKAAVPHMKKQGNGHLINVASMAGLLNPPGMSNYNVSKAAVISLSETLVAELKPYGIGATCLCPSFFKTNLGESMRSPDKATSDSLAKLMESSDEHSAEDIAKLVYEAVEKEQFLLMPHTDARAAWEYKNQDLDSFIRKQDRIAQHVKSRSENK